MSARATPLGYKQFEAIVKKLEAQAAKEGKALRKADGNGLYVEVRPSGLKTWLVRYRLPNGKQPSPLTIGHFPENTPLTGLSLAEARLKAVQVLRAAKLGEPVKGLNAIKRDRRTSLASEMSAAEEAAIEAERFNFRSVSAKWLSEKRPTWAQETYRKARYIVDAYLLPELGDMDMRTLTTKDVKPLLLEMAASVPVLAKKARQHIQSIVGCAIDEGMRGDDQVLRLSGILPKNKGGHMPAITESEDDLAELLKAIERHEGRVVRAALKLAALTALRPGIVVSARWSEINMDAAEWKIPGMNPDGSNRMKTGKDFSTSLPTQALALLEEMRPMTGGTEYVFPPLAQQRTPHLHRDSLGRALRKMGFQGKHSTHGFRATLRTFGRERLKIDIDVLETQLAHAPRNEVDAAYARVKFTEQRQAVLQGWADYLDSLRARI